MTWQYFALGSAFFAALTAILGKTGVSNINSNLATLIRTIVILAFTTLIVLFRNEFQPIGSIDRRSALFLTLSGISTGASWLCYYKALQLGEASRVAPLEKVSIALTVVLAIIFLNEPVSLKVLIGTILIVMGAVVMAS